MHRDPLRGGLVWGAAATLLLPVPLAVVLGLGGLLDGLGDPAGGRACLRVGLALGVAWVTAIAATTAATAMAHLDDRRRGPGSRGCRGHRGRRRGFAGRRRPPEDRPPPPPPDRPV